METDCGVRVASGPWSDSSGQVTLDGMLSEACGVRYTHAAALAFFKYFYTGELCWRCVAQTASLKGSNPFSRGSHCIKCCIVPASAIDPRP